MAVKKAEKSSNTQGIIMSNEEKLTFSQWLSRVTSLKKGIIKGNWLKEFQKKPKLVKLKKKKEKKGGKV